MADPYVHVILVFEYFLLPCYEKCFLKVGRRWREEESANCLSLWFKFCVSYQMLCTKCCGVGTPPWTDRGSCWAYLQHFISSFYESIVNKRETRILFGAGVNSCSRRPSAAELTQRVWGWVWTGHELPFVIAKKDFTFPSDSCLTEEQNAWLSI